MFFEGLSVHLLIAAAVALIVVGPKELPSMLRKFGRFMAKVRSMAAEFRASFDEMARQSELDELRKEVEAMRQGQLTDMATHAPEVNQTFNEISQGLSDVGVTLDAPYTYGGPETTVEMTPLPKARKGRAAAKAPAKAAAKKAPAKAVVSKAPALNTGAQKTVAPKVTTIKTADKASAKVKAATTVTAAKASAPKPRARKATVS
jgi:sec-independent protein translocase protein TatB